MSELKEKAISASKWALLDNIMNMGGSFLISLVLARLLKPSDYGLIGMTTFFITFFNVFIRSGFTMSLVRIQDTSQKDYSTIFFFNIIVCLISYFILFFTAHLVADFFSMPELEQVIQVLGFSLILEGFSVVQTALRIKEINYKIQAQISIFGTLAGGLIAIIMAFKGFGVWSLVSQILIRSSVNTILYWITSKWRPRLIFSLHHLKRHWSYSMSLLRNDLTIVIFDNLYNLFIGKFYNTALLGQYTRARNFLEMASMGITRVLSTGVSFPVLCKLQGNVQELRDKFLKFQKLIIFISSCIIFFFVSVSDALIPLLIGPQWYEAIYYIKLMAVSSFLYPIIHYNISIAKVTDNASVYANAILFQRVLVIPCLILGYFTTIEIMIIASNVASILSWLYISVIVRRILNVSIFRQFVIQLKVIYVPLIISIILYTINFIPFEINLVGTLTVQLLIGGFLLIFISELLKIPEFLTLKSILLKKNSVIK